MSKILGYLLSIIGIIGIILSFDRVKNLPQFSALASVSGTVLLIAGLVIAAIGILFLTKSGSSSKQPAEVPIYHGKNVVGFRRLKK